MNGHEQEPWAILIPVGGEVKTENERKEKVDIFIEMSYLFCAMFWKKRKKSIPEERRSEPRFGDLNEVALVPRDSGNLRGEKTAYYARTKNASPSGLRVETDIPLPIGSVVAIRLQSPKTKRLIQATGQVKWVVELEAGRGFEMGLEFVETSVGTILDLLGHIYKA